MSKPVLPTEEEVGITEFFSPQVAGFVGRFKERWQDFHVNEVDNNGEVLHLSTLITPGLVAAEQKKWTAERQVARAALGAGYSFDPAAEEEIKQAFGSECTSKLLEFLRKQQLPNKRPKTTGNVAEPSADGDKVASAENASASFDTREAAPGYIDFDCDIVGDGSKQARKLAHQAVSNNFTTLLNSETVEEGAGGKKCIRIWMREAERRAKLPCGSGSEKKAAEESKGGKGKRGKGKSKDKGKGKGHGKWKGSKDGGAEVASADVENEFGSIRHESWPKDRPDYLYFRLYKENCDTSEAVSSIARCVGRSPKQFTFAGTKDKRGVTVQQICAHRLPADQLRRTLIHRFWDRRLRISDLGYRPERLRLGMLRGNRFAIALRRVPAEAASSTDGSVCTISCAFEAAQRSGFLNYFGLQRFGTRVIRTHQVGAAVVAGRWMDAIRLILGDASCISHRPQSADNGMSQADGNLKRPSEENLQESPAKVSRIDDASDVATSRDRADRVAACLEKEMSKRKVVADAAKIYLEDGNAQAALDAMPRSNHIERCLLGALARNLSAKESLKQLPHQALSLYVHAAQSLVWNAVLSKRIRKYGRQPVAGDLTFVDEAAAALLTADAEVDGVDAVADGEADNTEFCNDVDATRALPAVRRLETDADLAGTQMKDVLLPLPGDQVEYPKYLESIYEESSQELLGLSLSDFHESTLVSLTGSYRAIAVVPGDLEWKTLPPGEEIRGALLTTDVSRLLSERGSWEDPGSGAASVTTETKDGGHEENDRSPAPEVKDSSDQARGKSENVGKNTKSTDDVDIPKDAAVTFSCTLPPSSYLTMFLREVTKLSTASDHLSGQIKPSRDG